MKTCGNSVARAAMTTVIGIGLCLTLTAGSLAKEVTRPRLVVPKMTQPPTVDGQMKEGEWKKAAAVSGFIGATGSYGKVMVPKDARIYLAHNGEHIYIGVWMELAPGEKPTMKYRKRDSKVYMDRQQFEIWLTPPTEGKKTHYQMIGNAYGALYDMKKVPALGIKNIGWNPDVKFKNSYKTGEYWTAELAIPYDQLVDEDHYAPEKPWGGMVAVAWPQRSWPFTYGWYKNVETHALMAMGEGATCVRLLDFTSLFENRFAPELALVNGEKAKGTFVIRAERGDMMFKKSVTVPGGEVKEVDINKDLPTADKKVNKMHLTVKGPNGKDLIDGDWMYRPIPQKKRKLEPAEPKPWQMTTRLSYAPLAKGAHCWADLLEAPMREKVEKVTFTVLNADGEKVPVRTARNKIVNQLVDREFEYDAAERYFWLTEGQAHGKYTVKTAFVDENGKELVSTTDSFKHKNYKDDFAWLGTEKYGETLKAEPPYEPLEVEGNTFKLCGRDYEMKGALPSQMTSQGKALLAGKTNLVAVVDGKKQRAEIAQPFSLQKVNGNLADFTGSYRVAGMKISLKGHLLFDGAMMYRLEAEPGNNPKKVDRLYLSVPVRKEVARYMWSTPGGQNGLNRFLSNLPDSGEIWNSDKLADFVPYVGLCDDQRAIQWFADNDHEWVLGDQSPCAKLVREDEVVEMQINFVRKPVKGEPFQARFGLIATPIKPMPEDWRNTILHFSNFTGSEVAFFYGPGHGDTGPVDWHDSKALAKANGIPLPEGKPASRVLANMQGEKYPDLNAIRKNKGEEAAGMVRRGLETYTEPTAVRNCYFHNASMYFEGNASKAFSTFFDGDWSIMPSGGWFHLRPVESYQDFFCFHLTQFAKFWTVPGMYFDECYYAPDYNVFNGQGKIMPDGSIRPSVGLTLQRDFLYRVRQCILDEGIEPFIWVHTSGIMAPYAIGATDIAMFGEPNIPTPQQDIIDNISEQYMRVIGRSQKFGFVPVWMTMAGRGGPQWHLAGRQTFGWCWMHDTVPEVHTHRRAWPLVLYRDQWGIGEDDVDFHAYWNDKGAVSTDDEKYRVSFWTRPHPENPDKNKVLMMVMNMHYKKENNTKVRVTINPEKTGLPQDWTVRNLESMPTFRKREKILDRLDRNSNYGFATDELDKPVNKQISDSLLTWTKLPEEKKKYRAEELKRVSDGENTFTLTVPGRDFLTLIIQ